MNLFFKISLFFNAANHDSYSAEVAGRGVSRILQKGELMRNADAIMVEGLGATGGRMDGWKRRV